MTVLHLPGVLSLEFSVAKSVSGTCTGVSVTIRRPAMLKTVYFNQLILSFVRTTYSGEVKIVTYIMHGVASLSTMVSGVRAPRRPVRIHGITNMMVTLAVISSPVQTNLIR